MNTKLWELSDEIQQLETAIASIIDDESLTEEERETKLQETFNQWLSTCCIAKCTSRRITIRIRQGNLSTRFNQDSEAA